MTGSPFPNSCHAPPALDEHMARAEERQKQLKEATRHKGKVIIALTKHVADLREIVKVWDNNDPDNDGPRDEWVTTGGLLHVEKRSLEVLWRSPKVLFKDPEHSVKSVVGNTQDSKIKGKDEKWKALQSAVQHKEAVIATLSNHLVNREDQQQAATARALNTNDHLTKECESLRRTITNEVKALQKLWNPLPLASITTAADEHAVIHKNDMSDNSDNRLTDVSDDESDTNHEPVTAANNGAD